MWVVFAFLFLKWLCFCGGFRGLKRWMTACMMSSGTTLDRS